MTWLTIWLHTLLGGRRWQAAHVADPDLVRAQQIKREQDTRLHLIEREIESFRNGSKDRH